MSLTNQESTLADNYREQEGFNTVLVKAVDAALTNTFGDSVAKALKFHVEIDIIAKDPDSFRMQLAKIFSGSKKGSRLVEEAIVKTIADAMSNAYSIQVSVKKWQDGNLREFIEDCRSQYIIR